MVVLVDELRKLILSSIDMQLVFRCGKITKVNLEKMLIDVKLIPFGEQLKDIPCSGLGVSEGKGVVVAPKVGEYVLLLNYFGRWLCIGYFFDIFSGSGYRVNITEGEIQIRNKTGNLVRMYEDGKIEILNKNKYGIVINPDGHMYFYVSSLDIYNNPVP